MLQEWAYKPCGFVSYGGVSGGLRSVQAEKLMVTAVKMMASKIAKPYSRREISIQARSTAENGFLGCGGVE